MNRKSTIIFITLLLILISAVRIGAEAIEKIQVYVELTDDGTAKITQIWNVDATDGTEYFIPISHLNHMELENFRVRDKETKYKEVTPWDIDRSLKEKARTYGVVKKSDGLELCWGKTQYGLNEYTINFDYVNAIQSFSDYDGFNIRFINEKMDPSPKEIEIVISKDEYKFTTEDTKVWAFGFEGSIFVEEDGKIHAKSVAPLQSRNYANIMVRFNKGIFNPSYTEKGEFSKLKDSAMEGSDYDMRGERIVFWFQVIATLIGGISAFIGIRFVFRQRASSLNHVIDNKKINLSPKLKKIKYKKEDYYREFPLLLKSEEIAYLRYINRDFNFRDIFAGIMLKWIKDGAISVARNGEYEDIVMDGDKMLIPANEKYLFDELLKATDDNMVLDPKKLKKESFQSGEALKLWIKCYLKDGGTDFLNKKYLKINDMKFGIYQAELTSEGHKVAKEVYGAKHFLKDFTIIDEREINAIDLWDDMLIFAAFMGIGESVLEELKKINPEYAFKAADGITTVDVYRLYSNINRFSFYSSADYYNSSGGGGSSSSFGGGGFSGGGSGGGSR